VVVCRGYFESSTGFVTFGTRCDNPAWGRWTRQDSVGGSLGDLNAANRYTYANDNPVNVVDPNGTCSSVTTILTYLSGLVGVVDVAYLIAQLETITILLIITNPPIVLAILATLLTLGLFVDCLYEEHRDGRKKRTSLNTFEPNVKYTPKVRIPR
jgi:RHS repeat-associated protein